MSLSLVGTRDPAALAPSATVMEAIQLMESRNVGSIVVVEDDKPVGILTDRDVVLRVVCKEGDPKALSVRMVMSEKLVTAPDTLDIEEAAWLMREHAVRRLPVIGGDGELLGIVTIDDLIGHLGSRRADIAEIISSYFAPYQAV